MHQARGAGPSDNYDRASLYGHSDHFREGLLVGNTFTKHFPYGASDIYLPRVDDGVRAEL